MICMNYALFMNTFCPGRGDASDPGGRNVNNLNFTEVPQLEVAPLHIHPEKEVKVLGKDRVFL